MTGIDATQLRTLVVRPALQAIGLWSPAAENLIMGTAAQESNLRYLHQVGGPAIGLFQIEPVTYNSLWKDYLSGQRELRAKVLKLIGLPADFAGVPDVSLMVGNLFYAAAMARIFYRRIPDPLPAADDTAGLAAYWKDHYNTALGAGTVAQFSRNYTMVV